MSQVFHPRLRKALRDGPGVSEWLSVRSYDTEHHVYRVGEDRIASILEVEPVWDGTLDTEGRDHVLTRLEQIFRSIAEGYAGQILMIRQHRIEDDLRAYESFVDTRGDPDAHRMHRINSDLYRDALARGFGGRPRYRPRRNRLFVTLSRSISSDGLTSLLRGASAKDTLALAADELHEQIDELAQAIEELGTTYWAVVPERLLTLLRDLFGVRHANPDALPPYDEARSFGEQLGLSSLEVEPDGVWVDRRRPGRRRLIRALSLEERPEAVTPGVARHFLDLEGEGAIVINFKRVTRADIFRLILKKEAVAERVSGWGLKSPEAESFVESARRYRMETLGDEWVRASWHLLLWGETDSEVKRATRSAVAHMKNTEGFGVRLEDEVAPEVIRQSLPFGFDPHVMEKYCGRMLSYRVTQVVSLAPVTSAPRGTGAHAPFHQFLSRDWEPAYLSTFEATAPHMVVMGGTGSGKSLLVLKLLMEFLRLGQPGSGVAKRPYIGIIDIRETYRDLAAYIGGEYLRFQLDSDICVNPFHQPIFGVDGRIMSEEYDFQGSLLVAMVQGLNARDVLTRVDSNLLREALLMTQSAYRDRRDRPRLSDILATIESTANADKFPTEFRREARARVFQFTEQGSYGRLIDGEYSLRSDSHFQVFNLNDLQSKKEVQSTILQALIYGIRAHVEPPKRVDEEDARPENLGAVICDEVWALLGKSPVAAEFLEEAARAYRHYGVSLITITQKPDDFKTDAGQTILAQSPTKFFLQMDKGRLKPCEKDLGIEPEALDILRSVRTRPRYGFSEFLLHSEIDGVTGLYRFPASALTLWLGATSPEDKALKAQTLRDFGGDVRQTVDWLAANYPYGAKRGRVASGEAPRSEAGLAEAA